MSSRLLADGRHEHSGHTFRRLRQSMSWLGAGHLKDVVKRRASKSRKSCRWSANLDSCRKTEAAPAEQVDASQTRRAGTEQGLRTRRASRTGGLLQRAHRRHHPAPRPLYKALGIEFPSAVILHGPPGCGKTFAVDRLVDFLGWPSFQIDASSVASPYIHETSKKVAQVFDKAMENAPSVLVIDDGSFLADREMGSAITASRSGRVPAPHSGGGEERRADHRRDEPHRDDRPGHPAPRTASTTSSRWTSPAGRSAGVAGQAVILLAEDGRGFKPLAKELAGRPLSDVSFVVREGARLRRAPAGSAGSGQPVWPHCARHRRGNVRAAKPNGASDSFKGNRGGGRRRTKEGEGKGFAGLSSLVSDVDTTPPPEGACQPVGAAERRRPASQPAQPQPQPSQRQTYQRTRSRPPGGSSGGKWVLGIAAVIGLLWLIGQSTRTTYGPAYEPQVKQKPRRQPAGTAKLQLPSKFPQLSPCPGCFLDGADSILPG